MILNLVESLPRGVEAVLAAKGRPMSLNKRGEKLTPYPLSPGRRVAPVGALCSGQGGYPPPKLRWCFHGASPSDPRVRSQARRFQLSEARTERHPARDSGWSGAATCPNQFRGFSELILNWEKIYCNA